MTQLESARKYAALQEIVEEPNPESLLDLFAIYNTESGKFARIGKLVLVAPFIQRGARVPDHLSHTDIIPTALQGSDQALAARVREALQASSTSPTEQSLDGTMHDAGSYSLVIISNKILAMDIGHGSVDYGKADVAGRQRTVETFQTYMGPDIPVYAAD